MENRSECYECDYCQLFNDEWCVCWHPDYKGCKKQIYLPCLVKLDPIERTEDD